MEGISRIVSESLARHGFDRPVDYRRLRWSRWFRCESHHSLLVVPSRPGVFVLAEEIVDFNARNPQAESRKAEADVPGRMLAVTQFLADDDMAFVLDRMLSSQNPMRARLLSGRYFVRYVVIEDEAQRRSVCNALNQWVAGSGEKTSGIGAHFAASLEPAEARVVRSRSERESRGPSATGVGGTATPEQCGEASMKPTPATAPQLDSGAAAISHCPAPFPSGF
jgi:hypothetical protein